MNNERVTLDKKDQESQTLLDANGPPLESLWTPGDHAHARVSISVGRALGYGELKVSATVTYECDQVEERVNMTGLKAFLKAVELTNDSWRELMAEVPREA